MHIVLHNKMHRKYPVESLWLEDGLAHNVYNLRDIVQHTDKEIHEGVLV